jgi:hypothetical protein
VLDRESTFADPEILALLKERFVPVAIDQWYTRRQQDTEGDFWRQIAGQGPRNDFNKTTQGMYIVGADGRLIAFNNNRGPGRLRKLLQQTADDYLHPEETGVIERTKVDAKYRTELPKGAVVVRVSARVKGGYEETDDEWQKLFQSAVSRDNLWITVGEQKSLAAGTVPEDLALRIARFHLVDNTRGEPPTWTMEEVRELALTIEADKLSGTAKLETKDGQRGFDATLRGELQFDENEKLLRFNLLVEGSFWGTGQHTVKPPSGKFPLVISFTLADGTDIGDSIPPHASRGWLDGYLFPHR